MIAEVVTQSIAGEADAGYNDSVSRFFSLLTESARSLSGAILSLSLAGALACAAQEPSGGSPAKAVAAEQVLPPDLFAALTKGTRPQWRAFFRETIPRVSGDRYKAALALGAVCSDCYLAAESRDAQQIRNLLTDMATLEMTLGIARQMSSLRQKPTDLADAGDWPAVRLEITGLMARHAQILAAQKDEALADLERTGCWLQAIHTGARFAAKQPIPPPQPCIWSIALLADLHSRTVKLTAGHESKTLAALVAGLESLTKIWPDETTPATAAERLASTLKLLDSLMAELIDDVPAAPPKTQP